MLFLCFFKVIFSVSNIFHYSIILPFLFSIIYSVSNFIFTFWNFRYTCNALLIISLNVLSRYVIFQFISFLFPLYIIISTKFPKHWTFNLFVFILIPDSTSFNYNVSILDWHFNCYDLHIHLKVSQYLTIIHSRICISVSLADRVCVWL